MSQHTVCHNKIFGSAIHSYYSTNGSEITGRVEDTGQGVVVTLRMTKGRCRGRATLSAVIDTPSSVVHDGPVHDSFVNVCIHSTGCKSTVRTLP